MVVWAGYTKDRFYVYIRYPIRMGIDGVVGAHDAVHM